MPDTTPHQPTEETRKLAETLSREGVRQQTICKAIGVSLPTLHKHYRAELDAGMADAESQIARAAFDRGVHDKDTTMLIWLTKTRLHWKDTSRVIVEGDKDKPLRVEHSARDKILSRIDRLAAAIGAPEDPG